jgi:hypothetical protein
VQFREKVLQIMIFHYELDKDVRARRLGRQPPPYKAALLRALEHLNRALYCDKQIDLRSLREQGIYPQLFEVCCCLVWDFYMCFIVPKLFVLAVVFA